MADLSCFWCGHRPVSDPPTTCPECGKKLTRIVRYDGTVIGYMALKAHLEVVEQEDQLFIKQLEQIK